MDILTQLLMNSFIKFVTSDYHVEAYRLAHFNWMDWD